MVFRSFLAAAAILFLTLQSAHAEPIGLEEVLQQALDNSYDVKIAAVDIRLSRTDILTARSAYFPTVQGHLYSERLKDLENGIRPVTSVANNVVIPAGTRFQNTIGLNGNFTLLDFGVNRRKLQIAKAEVGAKTAIRDQAVRDLKLKVLDLYSQALQTYRSIQANESILELTHQAYQMKKRLYEAGTRSKVEVAGEAIAIAQTMDQLETLRHSLQQHLTNLSYYTRQTYDAATAVADIPDEVSEHPPVFDATQSPEARQFTIEIKNKQKEIELLKRQYLPQVSLYSYYNIYGFDPNSWRKSVGNLSQRTVSLGLSMNLPIFDGGKNWAAIQRAQLEKEKLTLQKEQKLAELNNQAREIQNEIETHTVLLQTKATIVNKTQDKLLMEDRLSEQQLVDKTQAISDHIARIQQQLDTEKSLIQAIVAKRKLQVMVGT